MKGTYAVQARYKCNMGEKKSVLATMENQSTEEIATAQASVGKQKPSKDAVGSFQPLTPRHQAGQWVFSSALPTGNSKPAPCLRHHLTQG